MIGGAAGGRNRGGSSLARFDFMASARITKTLNPPPRLFDLLTPRHRRFHRTWNYGIASQFDRSTNNSDALGWNFRFAEL